MKLRMIAGMLLLMILSFGVTSKADAAPHRGGHGYHRYGNSIKYTGGYGHGGYHRGHGYYGGGRGAYYHGHGRSRCGGGYMRGGRGCRR